MYNSNVGCVYGVDLSAPLLAEAKGITSQALRNKKELGALRIARILILDKYSVFLERQGYPTIVLDEEGDKRACSIIEENDWLLNTGYWNTSKLVVATSPVAWGMFKKGSPDSEESLSVHNQSLRRVLNIDKESFAWLRSLSTHYTPKRTGDYNEV